MLKFWLLEYKNPEFFWLLLIVPVLIAWYIFKYNKSFPKHLIPSLSPFSNTSKSWKEYFRHLLFIFRVLAIALLVLCIARPHEKLSLEEITTEGIDIMLALDVSGSMMAQDFKPDRLEASKEIAKEFIDGRPNDRIGLVVFGGESFTQCPLTADHKNLKNLIDEVYFNMIESNTAIGMALATSVDRIRHSDGISKVVILLTDGENNAGKIDPITAAEIAKKYNISVYTIGVGTKGKALSPVRIDIFGNLQYEYIDVRIDEETLTKISEMTGAKYFRATNNQSLREIYKEIDLLEKTKIEITSITHFSDKYLVFAILAFIILSLEIIFRYTILKTHP